MTRQSMWPRLLTGLAARVGCAAAVILLGCLTVLVATPSADHPAGDGTTAAHPDLTLAADTSFFRAGDIISDAVFFDSTTMSASDIQAFLMAQNPSCAPAAGQWPCLKDFTQDTASRAANAYCHAYTGASAETAATIIAKVAQACGINPRVLLVTLQKEQGLVTDSGSALDQTAHPYRYRSAMGMGCPDTAACDAQYYGFYNQLYSAAQQFQRYTNNPTGYSYVPGMNNSIWYSPTSSCGSSTVYIDNQATANLYNYTPYQPDAAALAAGYGKGDGCSSYGNRNFWLYFTDWFGSTGGGIPVSGAIGVVWTQNGGGGGWLGQPVSAMFCGLTGGGCGQHFQGGSIYWSPVAGTFPVSGAIRAAWAASGWESGGLGYPRTGMNCALRGAGCSQQFQSGEIFWTSWGGAHTVSGAIVGAYDTQGRETGPLGYPLADMRCTAAGCGQRFEGGALAWSAAAGTHELTGGIGGRWLADSGISSGWGAPQADMQCVDAGCSQLFSGGTLAWTPRDGVHGVTASIGTYWSSADGTAGSLGFPVTEPTCGLAGGGCTQNFQGGVVAWSGSGDARSLSGAIASGWVARGGSKSSLGYPTQEMVCKTLGCSQEFQHGTLNWSPAAGVAAMPTAIADYWSAAGGDSGGLGYPLRDASCGLTAGGCTQTFSGALVSWSPTTGARSLSGAFASAWVASGGDHSGYGYAVGEMTCSSTGCLQKFQSVVATWTAASGVHVTSGVIGAYFTAAGGDSSAIGYPRADMTCGLTRNGCTQQFANALVAWSPDTAAHAVSGGIASSWLALGAERGGLGYPVDEMACTATGCVQHFQGGASTWTPSRGVHVVAGAISAYWNTAGGATGPAGYPVADMTCGLPGGGCTQQFTGGVLAWSGLTGTHLISGGIAGVWVASGAAGGSLGYPTSDMACSSSGCTQHFQRGSLTWSADTGAITRF